MNFQKSYSNYDDIVIGCTDLSILVQNYQDKRLIDPLTCLSQSIVQNSVSELKD